MPPLMCQEKRANATSVTASFAEAKSPSADVKTCPAHTKAGEDTEPWDEMKASVDRFRLQVDVDYVPQ